MMVTNLRNKFNATDISSFFAENKSALFLPVRNSSQLYETELYKELIKKKEIVYDLGNGNSISTNTLLTQTHKDILEVLFSLAKTKTYVKTTVYDIFKTKNGSNKSLNKEWLFDILKDLSRVTMNFSFKIDETQKRGSFDILNYYISDDKDVQIIFDRTYVALRDSERAIHYDQETLQKISSLKSNLLKSIVRYMSYDVGFKGDNHKINVDEIFKKIGLTGLLSETSLYKRKRELINRHTESLAEFGIGVAQNKNDYYFYFIDKNLFKVDYYNKQSDESRIEIIDNAKKDTVMHAHKLNYFRSCIDHFNSKSVIQINNIDLGPENNYIAEFSGDGGTVQSVLQEEELKKIMGVS